MPVYMDLHTVPGVTAKEVAEAHSKDVRIQDQFSCRTMTYWVEEGKGSVFCLIEAPDKESVKNMHAHAHGLIPNEIIEVNIDIVNAFLGRTKDPDKLEETSTPDLKVFNDPAFRVLMVTKTMDARLLRLALGSNEAQKLLLVHNTIVRDQLNTHDGREVEMRDEGFVASFRSVASVIGCSLEIQQKMSIVARQLGLRIGIHAGVPVNKSEELFGEALRFVHYLCSIGRDNQIIISSSVRKLFKEDARNGSIDPDSIRWLSHPEESFLESLIDTLQNRWQDPQFGITDFCDAMSMSKPQLYRKSVSATGMSPNTLLREYRLQRSLDLLRSEDRNVSQTTFDTGFSSPSYFTKCFQKRFGLQPMAYLKARV